MVDALERILIKAKIEEAPLPEELWAGSPAGIYN